MKNACFCVEIPRSVDGASWHFHCVSESVSEKEEL